jgi:mannosyltransferase
MILKGVSNDRRLFLTASILVMINLLLKLAFAGSNDLAMDEPFTVWWAQHPLRDIAGMLATENNPPLHFFLMHFWVKVFGISAFSVRLPSVIFSSITAGLIFMAAARHFSFKTGLTASLVFTLSVMHMSFSHEARVYPLFVMLAAWNLALMLNVIRGDQRKMMYVWLFISGILLVYSHYFGWIPLLMQWVYVLTYKTVRKRWKIFLILWIALLVAYLPVFWIFLQRFLHASEGTWVQPPLWSELYGNINRFLNDRWVTAMLLLFLLLALIAGAIMRTLKDSLRKMLSDPAWVAVVLWFGLPYLLMFLVSFGLPVFLDRYILFTTSGLYIVIAASFFHLFRNRVMRYLAYLLPLLLMLVFFQADPYNNRNIRQLSVLVHKLRPVEDHLIISPEYASLEFAYHYDRAVFEDYRHTVTRLNEQGVYPLRSLTEGSDKGKFAEPNAYCTSIADQPSLLGRIRYCANWVNTMKFPA